MNSRRCDAYVVSAFRRTVQQHAGDGPAKAGHYDWASQPILILT
jgi:hypothetical protein